MKKVSIVAILQTMILCICYGQRPYSVNGDQWTRQQIHIPTRWTNVVTPSNSLTEYPRPQMVRKNWTNLNGLWYYAITPLGSLLPSKYDGKILVPYPIESALSGVKKMLQPNQNLWYKTSVNCPLLKQGERLLIHFGAVDFKATVYVNGHFAGEHSGGYNSFVFDITKYVKEKELEIVVKVYDPTDQGPNPHGKQTLKPGNIYYTPTSGIWQTVWLETVASSYVSNLHVTSNIDKEFITFFASVEGADDNLSIEVKAEANGKIVASALGKHNSVFVMQIKTPHLWSPADPFLYDLKVRLLKNNNEIDVVTGYFGMRKVSIEKDSSGIERINLNNKYLYNLGVLDQGFWPDGLYTAPTDEALAFDINAIKAMGFNTIRKHVKVEPDRWYYHADKIGILVWQDFVNPPHNLPLGSQKEFEAEVENTLFQLDNHPCITTWVLFNEHWGAYDQKRLSDWIKAMDPTRLLNSHSGEILYVDNRLVKKTDTPWVSGDLTDLHSYPDPMAVPKKVGKAMVLGEFGGIGVSVLDHQWNDMQGWGYVQLSPTKFKERYQDMVLRLQDLERKGLSGSIYTQPFDVEGEENGLLTYDREIIKIPLKECLELHKYLNATSTADGNMHVAKDMEVTEPDVWYAELVRKCNHEQNDSATLRKIVVLAFQRKDQLIVTKFGNEYIKQLKDIFQQENLKFIKIITTTSKDTGFTIFNLHANRVNSILGKNEAEFKIRQIIKKEEIDPSLNNTDIKPNWSEIAKNVSHKFGALGEEVVAGQQMIYYWLIEKDWKSVGKYYKLYYEKAIDRSEYHINNISWDIFLHIDDREILEFASQVTKYNMEKLDNSPEAVDTYANLLYKLGKRDQAISWQKKAVRISNNDKDIIENLQKMEKGVPTWDTN